MDKYNPRGIIKAMRDKNYDISDVVLLMKEYSPKISRTLAMSWLNGHCPNAINITKLAKILGVSATKFFAKATEEEEREFLERRDQKKKKRSKTLKKFDQDAASKINEAVDKIDKMNSILNGLVKKKGTKKKARTK